ncbi:E3 ubiquitin-protein ligase RNF180-like [Dreissena polymorpha]|uniref:E3 ubiquitin-protein ligase RNF180-like n=1 Tax=Dreissena polymorpha TaxID=45954 RepID=UPI0022649754|nr:E3 ubiquitin-protein ligase RNF180-like [Dreissena polymorpha]
MAVVRCRKCRYDLQIGDAVIIENKDCNADTSTDSGQFSVWYLDVDRAPEWIQLEITDASWTKGKLVCPKCNGRLGSFDFLVDRRCYCENHAVPSVHLLKSRVDYFRKQDIPVVRNKGQIRTRRVKEFQMGVSPGENSATLDLINNSSTVIDHTWSFMPSCESERDTLDIGVASSLPLYMNKSSQEKPETGDAEDNNGLMINSIKMKTRLSTENIELPSHFEHSENSRSKFGLRKRSQKLCSQTSESVMQPGNIEGRGLNRQLCQGDNINYERARKDQAVRSNLFEVLQETTSKDESEVEEAEVEIPSEFSCPVCLELFYQPHECRPCLHVFCEHCLRDICKQKPVNTPCPLCRKLIDSCHPCKETIARIRQELPGPYKERKQELQRLKKTTKFYPLPQATSHHFSMAERLGQLEEQYSGRGFFFGLEDVLTQCIQDVVIRFAWLIMLFLIHNMMFIVCNRYDRLGRYDRHKEVDNLC